MVEWGTHLKPMNNSREHHFARSDRVKKQRTATRLHLIANKVADQLGPRPEGHRILVTFVRIASRKLDPGDNLNSSFKSIRDEIASYFGVNDGNESSIRFEYGPQLNGPSAARVLFGFEPHVPVRTAVVTTKEIATTPRQWAQRGLLKSGVVSYRGGGHV